MGPVRARTITITTTTIRTITTIRTTTPRRG